MKSQESSGSVRCYPPGTVVAEEGGTVPGAPLPAEAPDGEFVRIQLPCGASARVSPDAPPELVAALEAMMLAIKKQYLRETEHQVPAGNEGGISGRGSVRPGEPSR